MARRFPNHEPSWTCAKGRDVREIHPFIAAHERCVVQRLLMAAVSQVMPITMGIFYFLVMAEGCAFGTLHVVIFANAELGADRDRTVASDAWPGEIEHDANGWPCQTSLLPLF